MDMLAQAVASYMNGNTTAAQPQTTGNGRAVHSKFYNQTMADGQIFNPYLNRRWISAQFIGLIKKHGFSGVNDAIRENYDWKYVFNWLKTETEKIDWLYKHDKVAYQERRCFLSVNDVNWILRDYTIALKEYLNHLVYKTVPDTDGNIKVHIPWYGLVEAGRIEKIVTCKNEIVRKHVPSEDWTHLIKSIDDLATPKHSYRECFEAITEFKFIKIISSSYCRRLATVSNTFVDVFKKAGAYYTLKNLILFEGVRFSSDEWKCFNEQESTEALYKIKNYEGFRIFAILKKSLRDSGYTL